MSSKAQKYIIERLRGDSLTPLGNSKYNAMESKLTKFFEQGIPKKNKEFQRLIQEGIDSNNSLFRGKWGNSGISKYTYQYKLSDKVLLYMGLHDSYPLDRKIYIKVTYKYVDINDLFLDSVLLSVVPYISSSDKSRNEAIESCTGYMYKVFGILIAVKDVLVNLS